MTRHPIVPALVTLFATVALAGCTVENHGNGASGDGANASATVVTTAPPGVFALVRDAPPGFPDLGGTAEMVDNPRGGSDVSITLHGLKPNVRYLSHLHAGTCDQPDPGGPHFKFDLDGPGTPPNEIHLAFTANATRNASAEAHSARRVPKGAAGSIVVHQDAPTSDSRSTAEPQAAGGHARHGGGSDGGRASADAAARHAHSHADKIACAVLREPARSDGAGATTAEGQSPGGRDTLTIRVTAKEPAGGVQKLVVRKGDRVRFNVTSDQAERVHVHAYDVIENVGPGAPARFDFAAEIEGVFEVELEREGLQILSLTVNPR